MEEYWGLLVVYSPSIVFGLVFLASFVREPRQFRNAIWMSLFVIALSFTLLLQFGQQWMVLPIVLIIMLAPFAVIIFLIANTVIVLRHERLSLATLLPALLAALIIAYLVLYPLLFVLHAPEWMVSVASLVMGWGLWFFFSFAALLVYSWLYRALPRRRRYDYIIVHGAGLRGDQPTPLLRGRLDKAYDLWNRQKRRATIIVSGGQGKDEAVSEAEAMRRYLQEQRQVPHDSILDEDRSTTTMENLRYSKELMDSLSGAEPKAYRAALVTSDYHVFRASEYAHRIGLNADGVGSHTKGYYWPSAFIREFIAISRSHMWPYLIIAVLWMVSVLAMVIASIF